MLKHVIFPLLLFAARSAPTDEWQSWVATLINKIMLRFGLHFILLI